MLAKVAWRASLVDCRAARSPCGPSAQVSPNAGPKTVTFTSRPKHYFPDWRRGRTSQTARIKRTHGSAIGRNAASGARYAAICFSTSVRECRSSMPFRSSGLSPKATPARTALRVPHRHRLANDRVDLCLGLLDRDARSRRSDLFVRAGLRRLPRALTARVEGEQDRHAE